VRIILDAHVSGKRVGAGLRLQGHDVRAVDEGRALEGLGDSELLDLATEDGRALVTFNVRDFVPLIVERASLSRPHAGVLLVPNSIRHQDFGLIVSSVHAALAGASPETWLDRVVWVRRT